MKTSEAETTLAGEREREKPLFLYETDQIRAVTGSTIRPGGLSLTDRAMEFCGLPAGSLMIDIGCGPCGTTDHLARRYKMRAIGIDPSRTLLLAAREGASGFSLLQGVAESLPFKHGICDGIICECVLSLVKDFDRAIAEFARVLKAGGCLIISDMYVRSRSGTLCTAMQSCIAGARPQHEMAEFLEKNGFSLLLFEDHTELLKRLAVELIFRYGSLKMLGIGAPCGGLRQGPGPGPVNGTGYCLLVAKKRV